METFTELKQLIDNSLYDQQRKNCLAKLDFNTLDASLQNIVSGLCELPYCFPLQSCYGHFVHNQSPNPYNLDPLPTSGDISRIEYRIAYLSLCIENNPQGKELLQRLAILPTIDPANIQFGCANWFWERQVNSFVLQVEPERYALKDTCILNYEEALQVEKTRNQFFKQMRVVIQELTTLKISDLE
jgi:hypothetical protein